MSDHVRNVVEMDDTAFSSNWNLNRKPRDAIRYPQEVGRTLVSVDFNLFWPLSLCESYISRPIPAKFAGCVTASTRSWIPVRTLVAVDCFCLKRILSFKATAGGGSQGCGAMPFSVDRWERHCVTVSQIQAIPDD